MPRRREPHSDDAADRPREELCVHELTCALEESQPKVSRHLAQLRTCDLLADRRQGQWVYYRLHPELPAWVREILKTTLEANSEWLNSSSTRLDAMGDRPQRCYLLLITAEQKPMKVLFLCTANSCRSILSGCSITWLRPAEGLQRRQPAQGRGTSAVHLRAAARGYFHRWPQQQIQRCTRRAGTGLRHHRLRQGRWRSLPCVLRTSRKAHWGLSDPSDLHGSAAELDAVFDNTLEQIKRRLKAFIALPSTKWMPPSSRSSWPASERSDV
jgi:ArsR family transcriptional regulator